MAGIAAMNLDPEITGDRHNGNMSATIRSMNRLGESMEELDLPSDPDAQATVTDFLDFTEYLPSDMVRSLTLVGNLDQRYIEASIDIHNQTKIYGELPKLPVTKRHGPAELRACISESINDVANARTLSHAESFRMAENVDRHFNRAKNILAKLQAMAEAYPSSREASPTGQVGSPNAMRAPRIQGFDRNSARVPKRHIPRITVPGEALAPYEDYGSFETDSEPWDSADDEPLTPPGRTPIRLVPGAGRKQLIKIPKQSRVKGPKTPRPPRPPGVMGTNVHSAVAGISTSNALAKLKPPPENAVLGSADAPWLQLTQWELAKLRKRMKKNAVWNPSDTMIARELKTLGRGVAAYRQAKLEADASGQPFDQPTLTPAEDASGNSVLAEGAISADALASADVELTNRGMKLNEAKKLKRETQAKELAKIAAEEAEQSANKVREAASVISRLFAKPESKDGGSTPVKTPGRPAPRKRKRESTAEAETTKVDQELSASPVKPQKRSKMETPVPAPPSTASQVLLSRVSSETLPPPELAGPSVTTNPSTTTTATTTTTTTVPLRSSSPKKSSTPILPPTKEKKEIKKEIKASILVTSSERELSVAPTPTPPPQAPIAQRPGSRGKAASAEPTSTAGKDRLRRASTVHNTPAPEIPARPTSRRGKRPAPGLVTSGTEGSAVSVGKRTAAPRKKVGPKKQQKDEEKDAVEMWDEVDDEGNMIDAKEPRYCLCNRVSFGVMICCENSDVCSHIVPYLGFSAD
jgi:hypothetical protein